MSERLERWFIPVLMLLAVGGGLAFAGFPRDDALITYRYAERWAAGAGLSYQDGPAVLGTSTPLWTMLLATGARLGLAPSLLAPLLGALSHGLALPLIARLTRRLGGPPLVAVALYAPLPPALALAGSGMEAPLAALLALWLCDASLAERWRSGGLAAAFLLLLRVDMAPLLLLAALGWRARTRAWPWRSVALVLAIQIPWWAYAFVHFGSPLPQALSAKLAFYGDAWPVSGILLPWFLGSPARAGLSLLAFLGLVSSPGSVRWIGLWPLLHFLLLELSDTLVHEWYRAPPYPIHLSFAAVGLGWLASRWRPQASPSLLRGAALLALLSGLLPLPSTWRAWQEATARWRGAHGKVGAWLAQHIEAGDLVACGDIGLVGSLLPQARILDTLGLVSPEVLPYNRRGDHLGIYTERQPDWAVIGTYGPLYQHLLDAPDFIALYRERVRFPYVEGVEYLVFERIRP